MTSECSDDLQQSIGWMLYFIVILLSFFSIAGVLGNTLVILCILLTKKLQTTTNCFVFNLSFADVIVSAVSCPVTIYYWIMGCEAVFRRQVLCEAMAAIMIGCAVVSLMSLAWISFNRYLLIVHGSALYKQVFTRRNIPLMIAISWIWGGVLLLPPLLGWGKLGYNAKKNFCELDRSQENTFYYEIFALVVAMGIPLVITFICYVKIYMVVRRAMLRVADHGIANLPSIAQRRKREFKLTKDLSLIFGVFCLCATPYGLVEMIDHDYTLLPLELHICGNLLILSNSCWNPFLYAWRNEDFRSAMKQLLTFKVFLKRGEPSFTGTNNSLPPL